MQRDRGYLFDILEAAKLAVSYVEDKPREEFLSDVQTQDAVIRRLEIIGEAARRLSNQAESSVSNLPISDMISMRNILIHEYGDIDVEIVLDTVLNDLPHLISTLEKLMSEES